MQAPSDWWTIGFALGMSAWGTVGSLYIKRLLRPVHINVAYAIAQTETARSSAPPWVRRAHQDKARRASEANHVLLTGAKRWRQRVYEPVLVLLAAPTLVLAVWGVL